MNNSVDATVLEALQNKRITQKVLLDALKKDITYRLAPLSQDVRPEHSIDL